VTSGFRDPECHTASMTLRNEIRFLQALISLIGNDINDDSFDAFELSQKGENISQEDVELFLSGI